MGSNVTLSCDLTNLPAGTICSFSPTSVIPTEKGKTTVLTITVPAATSYGAFNVTVTGTNPAPISPTIFTLTVGAKIAVNPTGVASLSYIPTATQPSPTFTVQLNVTDSPPFAGFIVGIFYNVSVLQVQGIDYSGGVLGNDAVVSDECVNYSCSQGIPDPTYDQNGVASLVLFTNSGSNATLQTGSSTINGKLFTVTFGVIGKGFSAIHFVHQEIQSPCAAAYQCPTGHTFFALQSVGYDGYFTNVECGTGNLCKPPIVSFIPPLRPIALRPVSFNATAVSQNPSGTIREYNWTSGSGQDVTHYNSPPKGAKLATNATFTFLFIGEHEVTLSAQDNYGARAYYTLIVDVFRVWVDLGISAVSIDNTIGVFPGTVVHIVATATNNGVNPENSTLRLSINNQSKANQSIMNLGPILESSLTYNWKTAGLTPRVYQVNVALDEVRNPNTNQVLENDTAIIKGQSLDPNNLRVAFVQIIEPVPPGNGVFLGLSLPETLGLGIILIAVIVFAAGLVRKSRARELEPL